MPKRIQPPKPNKPKPVDLKKKLHDVLYGRKWKEFTKRFLAQPENILCRHCLNNEGQYVAAECVDHVIPHRYEWKLFWCPTSGLQPLCCKCHKKKTEAGE